MLFLRTAAGGFVNAATIVRLCEETDGWVAICEDDKGVVLTAYYNRPGRLKELQHLVPPISLMSAAPVQEAACGGL